jgi:hypothetical protein
VPTATAAARLILTQLQVMASRMHAQEKLDRVVEMRRKSR